MKFDPNVFRDRRPCTEAGVKAVIEEAGGSVGQCIDDDHGTWIEVVDDQGRMVDWVVVHFATD